MKKYVLISMTLMVGFFMLNGCQAESITNDNAKGKEEEPNQKSETGKEVEQDKAKQEADTQTNEKVVLQNEAFQIIAPIPNQKVDGTFIVEGKARVFEANFQYRLEDGHNILAEGNVMANQGAPEWGDFKFEIHYEGATSPQAVLILFEGSPKDGSPQHELLIPLRIQNYQ